MANKKILIASTTKMLKNLFIRIIHVMIDKYHDKVNLLKISSATFLPYVQATVT